MYSTASVHSPSCSFAPMLETFVPTCYDLFLAYILPPTSPKDGIISLFYLWWFAVLSALRMQYVRFQAESRLGLTRRKIRPRHRDHPQSGRTPQLFDLPTETLRKILGLVQGDAVVKCCFNGSDCVCKHLRPPCVTTNIIKDPYSDIKLVCRRLRAIANSVEEPITLVFPRTNCTKSYSRLGSLARIRRIGAI